VHLAEIEINDVAGYQQTTKRKFPLKIIKHLSTELDKIKQVRRQFTLQSKAKTHTNSTYKHTQKIRQGKN